jgi:hypothetical protein
MATSRLLDLLNGLTDSNSDFMKGGGAGAIGDVAGNVLGLASSDSKYKGGQRGSTVGSVAGTVLGSFIGMPGLGAKVGGMIGGAIGGASDNKKMMDDYVTGQKRRNSKLSLSANIDPYGSDNTYYMREGGVVGDDPVAKASQEAKRFAKARGLVSGDNTYVDAVPQYVDGRTGKPYKPTQAVRPQNYSDTVPSEITDLLYDEVKGYPYFNDPHTGDMVYTNQTYMNLPRFQKAPHMADGGSIHIQPSHKGRFTKWAKANGMSVSEAADHVMANKGKYSTAVVKMANFAKNARGFNHMEDGGQPQGEDQPQMINIEKGEILIDPNNLEVVREYDNPNRYKKHSKNPLLEPVGNFTMADSGHVVISVKYADRFKKGDKLTRKSITAEILKNQRNNPEQNAPRSGAPFAEDGMFVGEDPIPGMLKVPTTHFDTYGGYMKKKLGLAGALPLPIPGSTAFSDPGTVEVANIPRTLKRVPGYTGAGVDLSRSNIAGTPPVGGDQDSAVAGGGVNKDLLASKVLTGLSTAYGVSSAMGHDPYLQYDENQQYDNAKALVGSMESNPNINASLAAVRRRAANTDRTLNNFNSPSVRAEVASRHADLLNTEGDIVQNASNIAMDARNRKRQTLASLEEAQGSNRLNMRLRLQDELRQDAANRRNIARAGISEGATNFAKQTMDKERIRSINAVARYYKVDPDKAELLMDTGAFGDEAIDYINSRLGRGRLGSTSSPAIEQVTRDQNGRIKQTKTTRKKGG